VSIVIPIIDNQTRYRTEDLEAIVVATLEALKDWRKFASFTRLRFGYYSPSKNAKAAFLEEYRTPLFVKLSRYTLDAARQNEKRLRQMGLDRWTWDIDLARPTPTSFDDCHELVKLATTAEMKVPPAMVQQIGWRLLFAVTDRYPGFNQPPKDPSIRRSLDEALKGLTLGFDAREPEASVKERRKELAEAEQERRRKLFLVDYYGRRIADEEKDIHRYTTHRMREIERYAEKREKARVRAAALALVTESMREEDA
jgi:hypothetical protein